LRIPRRREYHRNQGQGQKPKPEQPSHFPSPNREISRQHSLAIMIAKAGATVGNSGP
jgi:hypothetical protein